MATRTRANIGKYTHDNYSIDGTAGTKTLPSQCTNILVENMDANNSIAVSFDSGTTWKTIKAGSALAVDCDNILSYKVKSLSGTISVEAMYGSEI